MSACSTAWFAIPCGHLRHRHRRQVCADLLGLRPAELDEILSQDTDSDFNPDEPDAHGLGRLDGVACFTWTRSVAQNGGEWDAIQLRDAGIPHLRGWGACSAFSAGAEAFAGRHDPVMIRCDADGRPIVGVRLGRTFRYDAQDLRDLRRYHRLRQRMLKPV